MISVDSKKIIQLNPWHVLVGAIISAELLTFIASVLFSQLFWGQFPSREIIIIGVIDSFVVSLLVAYAVIRLMTKIKQTMQVNEELLNEISNRKRAEVEKEALEKKLYQAKKMEEIGTFAGGIAHDFNNILSAILGYTDLAKRLIPVEFTEVRSDLDQVVRAGHRARDLVKQILTFSRQSENIRYVLNPSPIVKEAIKLLRASIPTNIEINHAIDPNCGNIFAEPTQINQIVMNLCTNAFHAMEETGGVLTITLSPINCIDAICQDAPDLAPGSYVRLRVIDTGVGIKAEEKINIFNPYFTTKEFGKGTGLGLAIVHGIVKSYNGTILVESTLGRGTTFTIYLPTVSEEAWKESEVEELLLTGNERVLFVDDDEVLADMGKNMLERLGYSVTVRKSSPKALETFRATPDQFDLVFTDQTMPDMTGMDLAQEILRIRPEIPIILCTGYSSRISEEKAVAMGIREFAMKPLVQKDIAQLIRKVLDASRSGVH